MKREVLIILGLIAITLPAFWGVGRCGFINYDDFECVVNNPRVTGGLSAANFVSAWKTFDGGPDEQGLYIPFTMLSLALTATLFGAGPHGFHWVNLAFHIANAVLAFLFFRKATGAVWRSALLAAIFAVHPLRVESVAWIVERKDVLSVFLGLLMMLAYLRYARSLKWMWYSLSLLLFAAALLAKPAVVTLPCVLLLLDYWPLGRWVSGPAAEGSCRPPRQNLPRLILEKLPFLAMVAAISLVAMTGLATDRPIIGVIPTSWTLRLANVPVSYARYLGRMIWFSNLAILYPRHPWGAIQIAASCLLLIIITTICFWNLRSRPWLTVGWLWFLGVLVPMLGLVQVGSHAMADRYTYVSGIGVLMMLAWSIPATVWRRPVLVVAGVGTTLGLLILFTIVQTRYWRNSVVLFTHDIMVAGTGFDAELNLGAALFERGDVPDATSHFIAAVKLDPTNSKAQGDLAIALAANHQIDEALQHCIIAVRHQPNDPNWHIELATLRLETKQYKGAEIQARQAIALARQSAPAHRLLGAALCEMGNMPEGIVELKVALSISPGMEDAKRDLQRFQNSVIRK